MIQFVPDFLTTRMVSNNESLSFTEDDKICFDIEFDLSSIGDRFYLWYKFGFSLVPCVLLVIFSTLLISVILKGRKRHFSLRSDSLRPRIAQYTHSDDLNLRKLSLRSVSSRLSSIRHPKANRSSSSVVDCREIRLWRQTSRTSMILVAISVSSVLSRSPFIAMTIFVETEKLHYLTPTFWNTCYILVDLNSGLNLLFFVISKQFRKTLKQLFKLQPADEISVISQS